MLSCRYTVCNFNMARRNGDIMCLLVAQCVSFCIISKLNWHINRGTIFKLTFKSPNELQNCLLVSKELCNHNYCGRSLITYCIIRIFILFIFLSTRNTFKRFWINGHKSMMKFGPKLSSWRGIEELPKPTRGLPFSLSMDQMMASTE